MAKQKRVFEGIVTPVQDIEGDCLYIHRVLRSDAIKLDENSRLLGITDFFSEEEKADTSPCEPPIGGPGESCHITDCQFYKNGKCDPPKYKVRIVVEVEEVDYDG